MSKHFPPTEPAPTDGDRQHAILAYDWSVGDAGDAGERRPVLPLLLMLAGLGFGLLLLAFALRYFFTPA